MGPGSVSSLLKTALDVIYLILWVAAAGLFLLAVVVLFVPLDLPYTLHVGATVAQVRITSVIASIGLASLGVYLGIIQLVLARLRNLFKTLAAGDPFHPDNVRRLRAIGVGLAALEVASVIGHAGAPFLFTGELNLRASLDVPAWFAVIVVFVLAEVFREGARLRREAELTI
jgi:hypothetical protein